MNNDIPQYQDRGYTGTGYLVVRVTTASEALPLEGANVTVYGDEANFSSVIARLTTDNDGLTPKLALMAPPRSLSESANSHSRPFATYTVTVNKDGYYPLDSRSVPIFDGITSVQPADLIPLPQNGYPDSFIPYGTRITESETLDNT